MIAVRAALGIVAILVTLAACSEESPAPQEAIYREANGLFPSTYPRIMRANADGTNRRIVCDSCGDAGSGLYPSRDGSSILFETSSDEAGISWMSVPSSGGSPVPFPTGSSWRYPAWSRGETIAWLIPGEPNSRIGLAAPRSTAATLITPDTLGVTWFAWSPDGSRLVFAGTHNGDENIYTVRPDGTGLQEISATPGVAERIPSWSPRGDSVAFVREGSAAPEEDGIMIVSAIGGTPRMVSQGQFRGPPYFSPDGSYLLAMVNRGSYYQLVRVTIASGQQLDVPALGTTFTTTPWAPTGDLIVSFKWPDVSVPFSIYTSPSEGTPMTQINPDTASAARVAWLTGN